MNDSRFSDTPLLVGSGVTRKVLLQNNIFGNTGTLTTQVDASEKADYGALAPGFVNCGAFDLRPIATP
ncbi:hypothetical protein [Telluria aromaticivorans]|uniref:Uncharacterized protein n=1 Tax=Telluria aromaticivorans TaxID=2725995 RepID=A0A7Y2P0K1_9BURK|nr:hypothetical protein [Telluria aromaticivorans]NNG24234.1 hypothetical protein [Telluria aromaticivorans]